MAKVQGLDRLRAKLKALPEAAKVGIRVAMEQGATEIVDLARSLCPVDRGDLRDSIGWTWGDAPRGAMVLAQGGEGDLRVTVYAGNDEAYYARWVEFGTQKMAAQPFFFPAYRALRKRVKGRISRATTKAAKKVAAGGK
ncbi:MAG: HK97-gp10 family putative phage morphogenesis protein [Flavobacteriaceae bacterium]